MGTHDLMDIQKNRVELLGHHGVAEGFELVHPVDHGVLFHDTGDVVPVGIPRVYRPAPPTIPEWLVGFGRQILGSHSLSTRVVKR